MPKTITRSVCEVTNILGVGVSVLTIPRTLEVIQTLIVTKKQCYICVTGVHGVIESRRDPILRSIHNNAGLVTPDGMPLVWLSRLKGHPDIERVYGPDLLLATCEQSLQTGWSHFFYGGSQKSVSQLAVKLAQSYPGMKIAGIESPPFRVLSPEEDQAAIDRINSSRADILWVGLGTPKQEYWMAEHIGRINVPVMIGVGAAFDFHAGLKKQAPRWMQRSGLEWFYRLASEPRRLWKRYLINNPIFIFNVLLQITGLKKFPLD